MLLRSRHADDVLIQTWSQMHFLLGLAFLVRRSSMLGRFLHARATNGRGQAMYTQIHSGLTARPAYDAHALLCLGEPHCKRST